MDIAAFTGYVIFERRHNAAQWSHSRQEEVRRFIERVKNTVGVDAAEVKAAVVSDVALGVFMTKLRRHLRDSGRRQMIFHALIQSPEVNDLWQWARNRYISGNFIFEARQVQQKREAELAEQRRATYYRRVGLFKACLGGVGVVISVAAALITVTDSWPVIRLAVVGHGMGQATTCEEFLSADRRVRYVALADLYPGYGMHSRPDDADLADFLVLTNAELNCNSRRNSTLGEVLG